jgi:glucose-6-phosphate isomerase
MKTVEVDQNQIQMKRMETVQIQVQIQKIHHIVMKCQIATMDIVGIGMSKILPYIVTK